MRWSWDAPFSYTAKRYKETGDASIIWEGHKAGREIGYCHMEKLSNLDALPDHGFKVACFPVKIEHASAGLDAGGGDHRGVASSWPGLTRPSTSCFLRKDVDAGMKPGMTKAEPGISNDLIVRRLRSSRRVRRAAARFLRGPPEADRALRPARLLLLPGRRASLDAARHGALARACSSRRSRSAPSAQLRPARLHAAALSPDPADRGNLHARPDERRALPVRRRQGHLADRGRATTASIRDSSARCSSRRSRC